MPPAERFEHASGARSDDNSKAQPEQRQAGAQLDEGLNLVVTVGDDQQAARPGR